MIEKLIFALSSLPNEIVILILSVLPISELRGAIPTGIAIYKFSILKTVLLSIIGNFSFVIPFLWFLNNLHKHFINIKWYNKFFNWWSRKVLSKTKKIEKYEYIGLAIFVGIPFPATGAWSGCLASYLLELDFWKSVLAIAVGIVISCVIVTLTTIGAREFIVLIK